MKWYEGDIAQAVTMSKRKNAVFVVYVEGKDDTSTKLTSQINESNVATQLESETFVAIKIEAGTVTHNQFAAIYKNVPVPSLFFIGKNGNPIDTILDSSNASDLEQRINKVIEAHTGVTPTSSKITTNSSASPSEVLIESESATKDSSTLKENSSVSSNNLTMESTYETPLSNASNIVTEVSSFGPVCANSRPDITESTNLLEEEKAASQEEKIQKAKELLEKTRELKKQEEEATEKLKEIERRKMGKDVQEMRRRQQDQELKTLMEERQRAKNEEKAARDRILAQIASDKADRAARFGTSPPQTVANDTEPAVVRHVPTFNQNTARIQFRLPDGTTNTHEFDSTVTLQEVRNYITLNLKPPFKHFSLSTTFPRREFTEDDNDENLKDLELCPTSVILILPGNAANTVSTNTPGGFMSLIWFFLTPIIGIFDYFRSFFVRPRSDASSTRNGGNRRPASDAADANNVPISFFRPMKRKATESTAVRRQGNSNIHLLKDKKDSDDENNTWNGNSTQQM